VTHHTRNPIKRHGELPLGHFTSIPNELVRDTELSQHAYRLAIVIRSHANGYEVSLKSLAQMLGWCPKRTKKARDELVAARWLVIREYKTARGTRACEEYHLNVSRKFTEEEAARLDHAVTIYNHHVPEDGLEHRASGPTPIGRETRPPWGEPPYTHGADGRTKEYESEDQGEKTKGENESHGDSHPGDDWLSDHRTNSRGLEDANDEWSQALARSRDKPADPVPEKYYTMREWKEIEATGGLEAYEAMRAASTEDAEGVPVRPTAAPDSPGCWGCRTGGRDACSLHSPNLHSVSV
jgi:hypothetical protein